MNLLGEVDLGKFTPLQVETILLGLRMLKYSWEYDTCSSRSEQDFIMLEAIISQVNGKTSTNE